MRRKIKSSLLAKIFLITIFFLLCMGMLVYALLAWLMPKSYSNRLSQDLDEQAKGFISELGQVTFSQSGGLFRQFLQREGIYDIELYTSAGELLPLPMEESASQSETAGDEESIGRSEMAGENERSEQSVAIYEATYDTGEPSGHSEILSGSYFFSFKGSPARYTLLVYGEAGQITELKTAFLQIFPLLLALSALAALALSWIYAYSITKPILKISRISQQMSNLSLEWELESPRPDELGQMEQSLHFLSQKLSSTIRDLQAVNEKLSADIEQEKALEQARLDFFSAVSHELKTPITIIKGQLEGMLLNIGAYKDHPRYLARSLEVANTMESMVQEILTVARLEAAVTEKDSAPFECIRMIQDYLSENEGRILKKSLQVHCQTPQEAYIPGSQALMEKVFTNLIGNAIKYAPTGASVTITVQPSRNGSAYAFSIENTGTHIPEECFPKLFDAFYRVDPSRNRETGGSGLGLYLVQKILQQHESCCSVCNTVSGVRFFFEIPSTASNK